MIVGRLSALVAAASPSGKEEPAVAVMEAWLRGEGADVLVEGRNLAAVRDSGVPGPTLLLSSHLDTVPATAAWTRPPWTPTREGDRLYGLGANDAKGCVVALTQAFLTAKLSRGRLVLATTCEEETGRNGLEVFLPKLPRPDQAIVGEPTGLDIAVAQSGMLILDCMAKGKAGHAARPHLAENALYAAARDVLALEGLALDRVHESLGRTTLAVTILNGGERHNVIPDRCTFTVDLRTTPAYTHEELAGIVQAAVHAEVKVRSGRYRATETPPDAPVFRAARAVHPSARVFSSPTVSDWAHLAGVAAIKWGPGLSEVSHTADEWVDVTMVERAVGLYRGVIEAVLSAGGA